MFCNIWYRVHEDTPHPRHTSTLLRPPGSQEKLLLTRKLWLVGVATDREARYL